MEFFVELEEGVNGLIHISDLSWTKKVRHPNEIVNKDDVIEVMILNISKKERRISLGFKQIEENPWERFEEIYKKGFETTGKVVRTIEKGLIVKLPENVEGFVPYSQLSKVEGKGKGKEKSFEAEEEYPLRVIEFDKEQKKIVLSYDNLVSEKERKEVDDFVKTQGEMQKETIGDRLKEKENESVKKVEEKEPKKQKEKKVDEDKKTDEEPEQKTESEDNA